MPRSRSRVLLSAAAALAAVSLSGCVVAPVGPSVYGPPAVVVAPAPYYPMPAAGYGWYRHPHYGYGWRHPHHGWHRGWR